ncbi:MAG: hypothetical protein ABFC89_12640 [Methanospirillum sp.]
MNGSTIFSGSMAPIVANVGVAAAIAGRIQDDRLERGEACGRGRC